VLFPAKIALFVFCKAVDAVRAADILSAGDNPKGGYESAVTCEKSYEL